MDRRPTVGLPAAAPATIALVVPCFSHADYLPEMLQSVASQTCQPDEIVFVDDCSPDGTGEILKAFGAERSWRAGGRCELLVNDLNMGQAASLNRGISAASSDLIMILNDDDYLMHDAVESMLELFRRHRDLALIGAGHIGFAGSDTLAAASKSSSSYVAADSAFVVHQPAEVRALRYVDELDMTHSGLCFLKMAWAAVGGYETDKRKRLTRYSDRDFQFRVGAVWPIGVARGRPFALWRTDSSVDGELHS
jgi:glycosyltransferase involved in cell wall biosynthesis